MQICSNSIYLLPFSAENEEEVTSCINIKKKRQWVQWVETVSNTSYHFHAFSFLRDMYIILVQWYLIVLRYIGAKKDFSTFCDSSNLEMFFVRIQIILKKYKKCECGCGCDRQKLRCGAEVRADQLLKCGCACATQ